MDTHLPFVRPRDTSTVRRPSRTRPPAPPRPPTGGSSRLDEPLVTAPADPPMGGSAPTVAPTPTTVVQNVTTSPAATSAPVVGRSSDGYVASDAVITALIGGALVTVGLVAVARLGLGGSVLTPVEDILDVPHTPLLGLAEVGVGLVLVILGVLAARSASIVAGAVIALAGAIVVIAHDDFDADLALTRDLGWWMVGIGVAVALVNLIIPALVERPREG